jgi:hypothetical protein
MLRERRLAAQVLLEGLVVDGVAHVSILGLASVTAGA